MKHQRVLVVPQDGNKKVKILKEFSPWLDGANFHLFVVKPWGLPGSALLTVQWRQTGPIYPSRARQQPVSSLGDQSWGDAGCEAWGRREKRYEPQLWELLDRRLEHQLCWEPTQPCLVHSPVSFHWGAGGKSSLVRVKQPFFWTLPSTKALSVLRLAPLEYFVGLVSQPGDLSGSWQSPV